MPAISDTELKKRLVSHNYEVPPITATTRALLQKKLAFLDGKVQNSNKTKSQKPPRSNMSLIVECSSSEEEQFCNTTEKSALQYTDEERSSEDEDVDNKDPEDEEFEEKENLFEVKYDDNRIQSKKGINISIQTSPGLDDTLDSGFLFEEPKFKSSRSTGSSRFIANRQNTPIKSTLSYFSEALGAKGNRDTYDVAKQAFPLNSPIRRRAPGNNTTFDLLQESGASPWFSTQKTKHGSSHQSIWPANSSFTGYPNTSVALSPSATSSKTHLPFLRGAQANTVDFTKPTWRSLNHSAITKNTVGGDIRALNERSTYFTSQNVSKLLIAIAGFFFLILLYKYATLRQNIDVDGHNDKLEYISEYDLKSNGFEGPEQ